MHGVRLTLLHLSSVFSPSDIQFWNSRQSLEGLSVRSIIFGVFQSLVVLLYILDNETNFVVQVSVFIGLLIDLWKITKVMDVRVSWNTCFSRMMRNIYLNTNFSFPFLHHLVPFPAHSSNQLLLFFSSWTERTKLQVFSQDWYSKISQHMWNLQPKSMTM